jgi:hypothetical protein
MLSVVTDAQTHDELRVDLDAIVREGARRMLAAALEAEVDDYLAAYAAERDERGRRLVVRNGHARPRQVTTVAGSIPVRAPRVDDRRIELVSGGRVRFRSVILPPWCRKSPKVTEVLAAAVPARAFHRRLRARPGGVLRLGSRAVGRCSGSAAWCLAGRLSVLLWSRPDRPGLRGRLGGRGPLPGAAGAGPPVLFGHRGRAG